MSDADPKRNSLPEPEPRFTCNCCVWNELSVTLTDDVSANSEVGMDGTFASILSS